MMMREQFLRACPKDLDIYLQEKPHMDLEELAMTAERYLRGTWTKYG